jgi:hypothetical protein
LIIFIFFSLIYFFMFFIEVILIIFIFFSLIYFFTYFWGTCRLDFSTLLLIFQLFQWKDLISNSSLRNSKPTLWFCQLFPWFTPNEADRFDEGTSGLVLSIDFISVYDFQSIIWIFTQKPENLFLNPIHHESIHWRSQQVQERMLRVLPIKEC